MIRWTRAGAVSEPETLQVRVGSEPPGRVDAGAPTPSRDLRSDEILENVRHFTGGRRGPRTRPCGTLVLTALPVNDPDRMAAIADVAGQARSMGMERLVLHAGASGVDAARIAVGALGARADVVVMRVGTPEEASFVPAGAHAVVVLDRSTSGRLAAIGEALARARPGRVVLTWPLAGVDVPPATEAAAVARPVLDRLTAAGISAGVKGIPLCTLAPGPAPLEAWEARVWRSTNRFYVDADHQLDDALVFFPDVVRFSKTDSCRFCAAVHRCDGVVETWLRQGLAGPLVPLG